MSTPKNTLFNYFKKVSSPATPSSSPSLPKPTPSTPLTTSSSNTAAEKSKKKEEPKTPVSRNLSVKKEITKKKDEDEEMLDCSGDGNKNSLSKARKRIRWASLKIKYITASNWTVRPNPVD